MTRKRGLIIVLTFILAVVLFYSYREYTSRTKRGHVVEWTDKEVERQIKLQLGLREEDKVWTGTAKRWSVAVALEGENIKSLEDMRNFSDITVLTLIGTGVTDLSPLESLKNLKALNIYGGILTNLSPLGTMGELADLDIEDLAVSSLEPLRDLNHLSLLYMSNLDVVDLSPIPVESLENISFCDLPVKDITFLEKATNLSSFRIKGMPVHNVDFLCRLKNLRNISITDCPVADIGNYQDTSLKSLELINTKIKEVPILPPSLKGLVLENNMIQNYNTVSLPQKLFSLEIVNSLSDCEPFDIRNLESCMNLSRLTLSNVYLKKLNGIEKLNSLEVLEIPRNQVTDISPIGKMKYLGLLDLSYNPVEDFSPLIGIESLDDLMISGIDLKNDQFQSELGQLSLEQLCMKNCNISNINFLSESVKINNLDISSNRVSGLEALQGLDKIERLNISGNPIDDLNPLEHLNSLQYLAVSGIDLGRTADTKGIDVLDGLPLREFVAEDCGLDNVEFLPASLGSIDISGNNMKILPPLSFFPQLQKLDVSDNFITDEYMKEAGAYKVHLGIYQVPGRNNLQIKILKNQEYVRVK